MPAGADLIAALAGLFPPMPAPPVDPPERPAESPAPLADLSDALDAAEERAAIMEHDGGLSRPEAEACTLAAVIDLDLARRLRARWGVAP